MPKLTFQSGRGFDAGLAALAAVSAGFVVFAMPAPLFSDLVETSRLPDLVAAAQPPLGDTARLAAVGAVALLVFALVWALMGALDRLPAPRRPAVEPEPEAPRLRRADAHPDAPARRPLLARDLGEPLDLEDFPEAAPEEPPIAETETDARPLPAFLVAQPPEAEAEPELDSEPVAEAGPEPQAEALPIAQLAARLPEAEDDGEQPLSQLVNRIEFGLSRKRQALQAAELPATVEEPGAEEERVGHRLRSAINDLQKIASGGSSAA